MVIRLGRRRCGKLRSFLSIAIAPNTFLREVPLTVSVSSSAWLWQMLIYLVRIPRRKATPINATCWPTETVVLAQSPHQRTHLELAHTGGISIRRGGSDRTTASNLDSFHLTCVS